MTFAQKAILKRIKEKEGSSFQDYQEEYSEYDEYSDYSDCHGDYYDIS